jgi:DNA mismatch repair protein MutL
MSRIAILQRETAEKIAAGEVVERPMSVVKELVENSIDAGSSLISVDIEEGGLRQIRITDDGCGMTGDELGLAVLRFATSKIREFDDLERLTTLGFRGEALPSIAAVSHMEIVSRPRAADFGHKIILEGGAILSLDESAADEGTFITVSRLFHNTPARKKFQKSPSQEAAQISGYLSKIALAHRHIHFRLRNNNKTVFNFPSNRSRSDCLRELWGLDDLDDLAGVELERDGMKVGGYVCHPRITRGNRLEEITFVNNRLIKNSLLNQAIQEGYHPFLAQKRFPLVCLFLQIEGSDIDVNVHPAKTEIRFARSGPVFSLVREGVAPRVRGFNISFYEMPHESPSDHREPLVVHEAPLLFHPATGEVLQQKDDIPLCEELRNETKAAAESLPHAPDGGAQVGETGFLPLAQLHDSFIVGEMDGDLWLIDQHASHERIVYERLGRTEKENPSGASQGLLFSSMMEFSQSEAIIIQDNLALFNHMGIEIEHFGGNAFVLRSLPGFLREMEAFEFVRNVVSDAMDESGKSHDDPAERIRKSMACRGSVQAGQKLSPEEMKALVADLLRAGDPLHCPHGRPTFLKLGKGELEKLFKRK